MVHRYGKEKIKRFWGGSIMELNKCCKNCHWYGDDKRCYHSKTFKIDDEWEGYRVGLISEEGVISDAIEEMIDFDKIDFSSFKSILLQKSLSKKKAEEIIGAFVRLLEDKKSDFVNELDCNITSVIDEHLVCDEKPIIIDPDNFCCNNYF